MTDREPARATTSSDFRMEVVDVFAISGRGVVAIGEVASGGVRLNAIVGVQHDGATVKRCRVAEIEAFQQRLTRAETGQTIGLLLEAVESGDVRCGDVITGQSDLSQARRGAWSVRGPLIM